jgi:hypothetical protein
MKIDNRVGHAVIRQVLGDISNEWLAQNRKRRLSPVGGQGPKALTVTGGENHRFHARSILAGLERKRPRWQLLVMA